MNRDFQLTHTKKDVVVNFSNNPEIATPDQLFHENAIFATPFGYAEGYYRARYETPETITWEDKNQPQILEEGYWKFQKYISHVPWPLAYDAAESPAYFPSFLDKLYAAENYLIQTRNFKPETQSRLSCIFCNYRDTRNCHFSILLSKYQPPVELRWPSIYNHYLIYHKTLPSSFFVNTFLEK